VPIKEIGVESGRPDMPC